MLLDKSKNVMYNKYIINQRKGWINMKLQFTLFCTSREYKPVSTILEVPSLEEYKANARQYKDKAIKKIAQQRLWDSKDLIRFGYTTMKVRVYDKEKIAQANAKRYEQIKKANGWT